MPDQPRRHYHIIKQELAAGVNKEGQLEDTWTITYRTPSGTVGYVRIPDELYSAENVDRQVQFKVEQIEQAHALSSELP